jgi:hypothetical protein
MNPKPNTVPKPVAPSSAQKLSPELRRWLDLQMRTLSYWVSLPPAQVPSLSSADRARDQAVLRGLKELLA